MPNPTPAPRRSWQAALIVSLFVVAVAAAAVSGWWYARESPPHQGPIVLVSVDALRADQLPVYGSTRGDTPAIDALAADGHRLTSASARVRTLRAGKRDVGTGGGVGGSVWAD